MLHKFDPKLSNAENWRKSDDFEFAAWTFAGHDCQEEYRSSADSNWPQFRMRRGLAEGLASGELVGLGVIWDDTDAKPIRVAPAIFAASDLKFDIEEMTLSALGQKYRDFRVCVETQKLNIRQFPNKTGGRPSLLPAIQDAWNVLKAGDDTFLNWPKSNQNTAIRNKIAELHPGLFPNEARPGDSTIRKHRSQNAHLFT